MGWKEAFAFGRRQYRLMLTHVPQLWLFAAFVMATPVAAAGAAAVLALQGHAGAIAALIFSIGLGELRYWNRRRIVRALWPETEQTDLAAYWRVERFMRPLWHGFHLVCIFAALGSRRISWAGFDYLVRGPQDVRVLRRPAKQPQRSSS